MPNKVTIIRPKLAPYQKELLYCEEKNTICEATTKCGKTFSHMWWLFEQSHTPPKVGANYWWIAPVYAQAKIAFTRIKRSIIKTGVYRINESLHTITNPSGGVMAFKSGENPDNLYGEDVYAAVLDEISRMREEAFIAVRSTLTATKGPMKLIGNVKGTVNWSYKLARKVEAGEIPDWRYFKITCEDAIREGILDPAEIEAARAVLPEGVFLELYYGIPFVNSSNKFCYAFNKNKHVGKCEINWNYPIYLSFDFNKNPICCGVYQLYDDTIWCPYVFKLANSDIYKLCEHIRTKFTYPGAAYDPDPFIVNGDASGNALNAAIPDNLNYFRIIKNELQLGTGQMQQLLKNPKIKENQVLVNAVFEHMNVQFDPHGAAPLIFDCEFVEMLPDGSMKKADREDPAQQADSLDTLRYFLNRNMKDFVKGYRNQTT